MPGRIIALAPATTGHEEPALRCRRRRLPAGLAKAIRAMTTKAAAAEIQTDREGGCASRQTRGTPPRVRPMNRLYMIQRRSTTSSLIGPARDAIASAAAAATTPSSSSERQRKRRVVSSAMAVMKPV